MKLTDIDVDELVHAFRMERSAWIDVAREAKRKHTEAEGATICILSAIENILKRLPPK